MTPRRTDAAPAAVEALLRRVLGGPDGAAERAAEGVSSEVYRARRGDETFYLRLAEDPALDMAPEVEAHERLRALGVRVAEIVHYEPFAPEVGRSVSVTSEIRGTPLIGCTDEAVSRDAARAVGRELALLNSIETQGDLAHFLVHDTEQNQYVLLPDVIRGYSEVTGTDNDEQLIRRTGVLIGTFRLSYALARWGEAALGHPYVRSMSQRTVKVLARIDH